MRLFACPECRDPYDREHPRVAVDEHDTREEGDVLCYVCERVMRRLQGEEERVQRARLEDAKPKRRSA